MELPKDLGAALTSVLAKQQAAVRAAEDATKAVAAAKKAAENACQEVARKMFNEWPRDAVESITRELAELLDWRIE